MPAIFKAIKPKAFKSDVFRKAVAADGERTRAGILKDFERGVKNWDHKVDFDAELVINPDGGVSITVDTDDEIYTFVHEGTRPHRIRPRRAQRLRFQGTYTAKTVPGVISSRPGGSSGDFVYSRGVDHPGTKGRFFSKPIFKKWRPFFERSMQRALEEAAKASGHSI